MQHKHIPGIFSKYLTSVSLDDEEIPLLIYDAPRIRPLHNVADALMVVFSVAKVSSDKDMLLIAKKLVPEVKRYCLNNPIVLVKSKIDLSYISEVNLSNTGAKNNPAKIGEKLAQAIRAKEHIGTFSNGKRVDKVFEEVQ